MDAYRYLVERLRLRIHQQQLVLAIDVAMHNFAEFVLGRNLEQHLSQDMCHGDGGTHLEEAIGTRLTL